MRTLALDAPDELPGVLRDIAGAARLDGESLVLLATRIAGRLNGREIVPALVDDPRYSAHSNTKTPRRIDSALELYDCINCDLCISACPNDAVFSYEARTVEAQTEILEAAADGSLRRGSGEGFVIHGPHQLAVLEGACNECSNCEVYCPEHGAPFRVKEQLFLGAEAFHGSGADGFCRDGDALLGRVLGRELRLEVERGSNHATLIGNGVTLDLSWEPLTVLGARGPATAERAEQGAGGPTGMVVIDTAVLWRMKTVWDSIYGASSPNPVNTDAWQTSSLQRPAGDA